MSSKWVWMLVTLAWVNEWCHCCLEKERIGLLEIKAWINHPNGSSLTHWVENKEDGDCCQWHEVKCDNTTGRVVELSLPFTREYWILGDLYLNASLFLPFKYLKSLHLAGNGLVGCFENQGLEVLSSTLRKLELLDLNLNQFNDSTLSCLSGLLSLKSLDLSRTLLTGSSAIKDLRKLEVLFLDNIFISESILLDSLRALPSLKTLYARDNNFLGTHTVKGIYNLTNLEEIFLDGSSLPENFLQNIGVLSALRVLSLTSCHLNATLPTRGFLNLTNLEELFLDDSPLPFKFLQSIGVFSAIKVLSMSTCQLNGTLLTPGWCELKRLEQLDLSRNNLDGLLPACFGNLSSLQLLDVSYNELTGSIASGPLTSLKFLKYLSLSSNQFQVPVSFKSFMNHSDLQFISCDNNKLIKEPTFQNFIPKFQLKFFSLSNCKSKALNASIPDFLYNQYDLRVLDLSLNSFPGMFPSWLFVNNTKLEQLFLKGNSFVGPFQLPFHPNPNLWILDVSSNSIQDQIPRNMCLIFPYLRNLKMTENGLTGYIPSCFGNISYLEVLDLSNNQLSRGILEDLTSSLLFLKLSNNSLGGQISPSILNSSLLEFLYLDGNNFEGKIWDISLNTWPSMSALDISNNHFTGMLPKWIGNFSYIRAIDFSRNHFEGQIPGDYCKLDQLEFLDLSENRLSGFLPSCFNLPSLSHVHLSQNQLRGPLTNSFYNSSYLVTLDLRYNSFTGPIPKYWIGNLSTLSVLLLKANHFSGEFPVHLCLLRELSILDMSHNMLFGPLPSCLGNLTFLTSLKKALVASHMYFVYKSTVGIYSKKSYGRSRLEHGGDNTENESPALIFEEVIEFTTKGKSYAYKGDILNLMSGIDLSDNRFTGEIPSEMGYLREIHALNLSHNNLIGSIPTTFLNLKNVESLDLSHNNLTGAIPRQLTELTSLAVFSVAFNNLSGKTPETKNQFGTFDERSYKGNPLLCGPPLKNSCSELESPSQSEPNDSNSGREHDGFMDMYVFFVSFGVCYTIVVLAIASVLYINPYWRHRWFYFIEECMETCYYFVLHTFHKLSILLHKAIGSYACLLFFHIF